MTLHEQDPGNSPGTFIARLISGLFKSLRIISENLPSAVRKLELSFQINKKINYSMTNIMHIKYFSGLDSYRNLRETGPQNLRYVNFVHVYYYFFI